MEFYEIQAIFLWPIFFKAFEAEWKKWNDDWEAEQKAKSAPKVPWQDLVYFFKTWYPEFFWWVWLKGKLLSQLPLQASTVPKAFDPAANPGGPSSGSAGPPTAAKSMPKGPPLKPTPPKGPPPKAEPASLAILLCLLDGSREGRVVSFGQGWFTDYWMDGWFLL